MALLSVSDESLQAVADAIREKGGTSDQLEFPDGFTEAIANIETGGGPEIEQEDSVCSVLVEKNDESSTAFAIHFQASDAGGVEIDWGDGSALEYSSSGFNTKYHNYLKGVYVLRLTVLSGTFAVAGAKSYSIYGPTGTSAPSVINMQRISQIVLPKSMPNASFAFSFQYTHSLKKIVMNTEKSDLGASSFRDCFALQNIVQTSPFGVLGNYAFSGCYNLTGTIRVVGPTVGQYAFQNCASLSEIVLEEGVESTGRGVFDRCSSLVEISFPSTVKSIEYQAITNCYNLKIIHVRAITPPTADYRVFQGIQSGAVVYVPSGSVEAYKTADGWTNFKDYIQAEPE